MDGDYKLPLGIFRHAVASLETFLVDVNEIQEDEGCPEDIKNDLYTMKELTGDMMAVISNIISREMDEEEFLAEQIAPDAPDEDEPKNDQDVSLEDMSVE